MPRPADALVRPVPASVAAVVVAAGVGILAILMRGGAGAPGPRGTGQRRGVLAGPAGSAQVEVRHGLEEGGAATAARIRVWVLEEADPLVHRHVARRRVVQVA